MTFGRNGEARCDGAVGAATWGWGADLAECSGCRHPDERATAWQKMRCVMMRAKAPPLFEAEEGFFAEFGRKSRKSGPPNF